MKKFLSILTTLALCLTLLPTAALAGEPASVSVAGTWLETDTYYKNDGSGGITAGTEDDYNVYLAVEDGAYVLTLKDVDIVGNGVGVFGDSLPLEIVLIGDNKVDSGVEPAGHPVAIEVGQALTISGEGSLLAVSHHDNTENGSFGIRTTSSYPIIINGGDITVKAVGGAAYNSAIHAGGNIEITGGIITAFANSYFDDNDDLCYYDLSGVDDLGVYGSSCAIYSECSGSSITITGGVVYAYGGTADMDSCGIGSFDGEIVIGDDAEVHAYGGPGENSYGIGGTFEANVTIGGEAKVTAVGGEGTEGSYGIGTHANVIIDGAEVTATGGEAGGSSYGIGANGEVSIGDGAEVTASGGEAGDSSYGIGCDMDFMAEDSAVVTAEGGEAGAGSYGIGTQGNLSVDGADVTATGGEAGGISCGLGARKTISIDNPMALHLSGKDRAVSTANVGQVSEPVTLEHDPDGYRLTITDENDDPVEEDDWWTSATTLILLPYEIYVGGVGMCDGDEISGDIGTASYAGGVLTLEGYSYAGMGYNYSDRNYALIYADRDLTIELEGENSLAFSINVCEQLAAGEYSGVICSGDLSITGGGRNEDNEFEDILNIAPADGDHDCGAEYGVTAGGDLAVEDCGLTAMTHGQALQAGEADAVEAELSGSALVLNTSADDLGSIEVYGDLLVENTNILLMTNGNGIFTRGELTFDVTEITGGNGYYEPQVIILGEEGVAAVRAEGGLEISSKLTAEVILNAGTGETISADIGEAEAAQGDTYTTILDENGAPAGRVRIIPAVYTVIFDSNYDGGTDTELTVPCDEAVSNFYSEDTLEELEKLDREDYIFCGWYTDTACTDGNEFDLDEPITEDITVYAKWTSSGAEGDAPESTPDPSYDDPNHPIIVKESANGAVKSSHRYAEKGEKVTLTVKAERGYVLAELVAMAGRKEVELTEKNGVYTFKMPDHEVVVTAKFAAGSGSGHYGDCPRDNTCPIWPYTDAKTTEWYHDGVHFCLQNGLMSGYGNGIFSPNGIVTRQQVWMILARLSGETPANMTEAKDWAVKNGVSDGTNPTAAVTRQQFATMLFRYAVANGMNAVTLEENLTGFADANQISEYAVSALNWAVGQGVMGGYADSTLRPLNTATRAHVATMLKNYLQ